MSSFASEALGLFLELAEIPSPPGEERAVADRIHEYLDGLGLEAREDEAGREVGSTAGNIFARLEPEGDDGGVPILFCAHMDTVVPTGAIEPTVEDGVVRNAGGTILGADNKAAIAAMLDAARLLLAERRPHGGVEFLFTVREETGCQGAAAVDDELLSAEVAFVYDMEGSVGDVVIAAPHARTIDAVFKGRPAHAAINPEEGRSAIVAASRAIGELRLGRLDHETTANVGTVKGGVARNVVPERCEVVAEARSLDPEKLDALVAEVLECFAFGASVCDCELETQVTQNYAGYRHSADALCISLARDALERSGHTFRPIESNGGADANVLNARGLATANLANGMQFIHSPQEQISTDDLEAMVGVTLGLVDAARRV